LAIPVAKIISLMLLYRYHYLFCTFEASDKVLVVVLKKGLA